MSVRKSKRKRLTPQKTLDLGAPVIVRSEGQRLLMAAPGSTSEVGNNIGVTRQAVADWRCGNKVPNAASRAALWSAYQIPAQAWVRMPDDGSEPAPTNGHPPAPAPAAQLTEQASSTLSSPTTLEETDRLLASIRLHASDKQLMPNDRVRLADAEGKILSLRHRMQRDTDLLEDRIIREHPAWQRVRGEIARVLARHPQAADEVADALDRLNM